MVPINLLKGQFHILFIIVVIQVFAEVMHFQKIDETDLCIELMVLNKM